MFVATFQKSVTVVRKVVQAVDANMTQDNSSSTGFTEVIETNVGTPGTNILGLITFSILFGFAVHSLGPDAVVLADMFHAIRRVIVYLVSIVIWFSPVGIMCLIASELAGTKDLEGSIRTLSLYVATVMAGLFIHGCIVLPALLYLITKRNPLKYAYNMMQALMCALGTASSTATLPCTVRCLESGNQIDPRVTRFMLPLGTSINMDGTALFQAIAAVYISQLLGNTLEMHELVLAGMTAVLASMAASSMPSAGMITIVMVCFVFCAGCLLSEALLLQHCSI
jgi:Na+/H+-dicarboxylate symporter